MLSNVARQSKGRRRRRFPCGDVVSVTLVDAYAYIIGLTKGQQANKAAHMFLWSTSEWWLRKRLGGLQSVTDGALPGPTIWVSRWL